jgi:hypothetical protein
MERTAPRNRISFFSNYFLPLLLSSSLFHSQCLHRNHPIRWENSISIWPAFIYSRIPNSLQWYPTAGTRSFCAEFVLLVFCLNALIIVGCLCTSTKLGFFLFFCFFVLWVMFVVESWAHGTSFAWWAHERSFGQCFGVHKRTHFKSRAAKDYCMS